MKNTKNSTGKILSDSLPTGVYEYYLIFDCETTTDETQALRFGVFELHGYSRFEMLQDSLDSMDTLSLTMCDGLLVRGLFYNPVVMQEQEVILLQHYAAKHAMRYYTVNDFVSLFYTFAHAQSRYTLVIGHNLPFDISRLVQEVQFPKGDFENGFSLKLCDCSWERQGRKRSTGDSCRLHPSIKIKKISPKASIFEFADKKPRGNFCDTATLARALLGPGSTSLETLGNVLGIDEKKLTEQGEHGQELNEEYIDYAVRDVRATWQIFCKLREIYASYNFKQKLHYIFSEASLGKALYRELGIEPAMKRMQDIPQDIHGYAMASYYGGRSEVHVRREMVQVAYCDFKSQYPSVFALMNLQYMLLGEEYVVVDKTSSIKMLLEHFNLDCLQNKYYWNCLRQLCKISGSNLILPVRAQFNGISNNIALCNVELEHGTWYTFADVLAGILLGGSIPTIEQAIEVVPHGRIETRSLEMFDGLVAINPSEQNIFTTLIDQRTRIKKTAKKATGQEKEKLERTQLALKLLANSTSYGINVELRTEDSSDDILLYGNDGMLQAASSEMQQPGLFYCPLIGCHIPAGGRLFLAIAQRLGADRGLSYAMCDTDSMAFSRPSDMPLDVFYDHVDDILDWFRPLYPYQEPGELFELEDVNLYQDDREALYFLGVSAKRYVLFNLGLGSHRIRKVSSHGLGAFRVSDSYKSPKWISRSEVPLKELGLTQHTKWIYDIWFEYVKLYCEYGSSLDFVQPLWERPNLDSPAYQQTVLATAYLFKLFQNIPGIRPFNFVTTFFSFSEKQLLIRKKFYPRLREEYQKCISSLYVPYTTNVQDIHSFYVVKSNECVKGIKPLTVQEAILGYFNHPEYKAANGFYDGEMEMRHVRITGYIPQGKESSYEVLELEDSGLPTGLAREAIDLEYFTCEQWDSLKERIREYGIAAMARKVGLRQPKLSEILSSSRPPKQQTLQQIKQTLGER